eukprot:12526992-Ditylum_brightwellii.AAC.1
MDIQNVRSGPVAASMRRCSRGSRAESSRVALPTGESCAGWVAVHAIDFYNDVSTLWAVMATDPYLKSFRPGEGFPSG